MNELTFLDLVILEKLDAESSVESFGSAINTSFFETANLLGTLKIKGYVDIEASVGGISSVSVTDAGAGILALAKKKSAEPVEPLDNALLHALAGGAKDPEALQAQLNVRSGDLAYHIGKMVAQGFVDYDVRSAKVGLMLTEKGFNAAGGVKAQGAPAPPATEREAEGKKEEGQAERESGGKEDILHILRGVEEEERKRAGPHKHGEGHAHHGEGGHVAHGEEAEGGKGAHHEAHKGGAEEAQRGGEEHSGGEAARRGRELGEEERKKQEKSRRLASKIQYYLAEYWAWILLIIAAIVIFAGAIYSMVFRMLGQ